VFLYSAGPHTTCPIHPPPITAVQYLPWSGSPPLERFAALYLPVPAFPKFSAPLFQIRSHADFGKRARIKLFVVGERTLPRTNNNCSIIVAVLRAHVLGKIAQPPGTVDDGKGFVFDHTADCTFRSDKPRLVVALPYLAELFDFTADLNNTPLNGRPAQRIDEPHLSRASESCFRA